MTSNPLSRFLLIEPNNLYNEPSSLSPQHQVQQSIKSLECKTMQAAGGGGGGGQAFGHATGEKQKASKVFGRARRLLWELLGQEFFRRGEWKLCFDKKASWPRSLTPNGLALTFREYTGNEVLEYSGHSEGSWPISIYQFHLNDLLLLIDQSEPVALGFQEDGRRSSHLLGPQLGSTHMQWDG